MLVVHPLKVLKLDQKERAEKAGISCVLLNGGQSEQTEKIMGELVSGVRRCKLLFLTPEMWGLNTSVKVPICTLLFLMMWSEYVRGFAERAGKFEQAGAIGAGYS